MCMHIEKIKIKSVVIACCTYKRPEKLNRLLKSLCNINFPYVPTKILIVDNDKEQSAKNIVEKFQDILNIQYVVEEEKGLSNVRNRAIKEAKQLNATHLAFIDDDEIADVNWLVNHIEFYEKFDGIYISSGPTYKKFENNKPDYIVNNRIFKVSSRKILGTLKKTCASGNVFFPLNHEIYFSKDFNFSGGEDTDFFSRMNNAGFKIGWNINAVNYEIVSDERANLKWILKRAYNNGIIKGFMKIKHKNLIKRFLYLFEISFIIAGNFILSVICFLQGLTVGINQFTKLVNSIGKFKGLTLKNIDNSLYGE